MTAAPTTKAIVTLEPAAMPAVRTPLQDTLRRVLRHRSAQTGLVILAILILIAVFAPMLAPFDPIKPLSNVKRRASPCLHFLGCPADEPQHIFGIDSNNRDLFSR